jgi:hydrogenase maturation factor
MSPEPMGPEPMGTGAECVDEVCLTCSDAAVPVVVERLLGDDLALVDTGSGTEEISIALVDAEPGDTVLVHAKEAIAVLPG